MSLSMVDVQVRKIVLMMVIDGAVRVLLGSVWIRLKRVVGVVRHSTL